MIGVFDSGVGGLSVVSAIRDVAPGQDVLYVADRARAPYGTRLLDEVLEMSHEVAAWLLDRGSETLVVACNTASAAALESLRSAFEVPIVGMEPAVKPAAELTNSGVVGVFATAATFQGRLFESVVDRHASDVEVLTRACPEWVDLVETGITEGEVALAQVAPAVRQFVESGADALVLGCTHFSFLGALIGEVAGPGVKVIDPALAVARQTARVHGLTKGSGRLTLAASGDLDEFETLVSSLVSLEYEPVLLPFPA